MEWIRISPNKLKIMLTAEDARHYELDCMCSDYADGITRAAFREILTDVGREIGFDAADDKTYIQMYPSKEGGCELFVTKIGLLLTEEGEERTVAITSCQKGRGRSTRLRAGDGEHVWLLEKTEALLSCCRALSGMATIPESSVYRDERERWWLMLTPNEETDKGTLAFLSDFGQEIPADAARLFLAEHARAVCESNAIQTLGKL